MDLGDLFQQREQRDAAILAAWQTDRKRCRAAAVLTYKCAARECLLILVWRTPLGLAFIHPAYKLARGRNEELSNAAGRAANTSDGVRHWRAYGGLLDDLDGWEDTFMNLVCDHVNINVSSETLLAEARSATPGNPTRRIVDSN